MSASLYHDNTYAVTNGINILDGPNLLTAVVNGTLTSTVREVLPASVNLRSDANGNLIWDGLKAYAYDCANQLTSVTVTNGFKTEYAYDGLGRRRVRLEYAWSGNAWTKTNEVRYVWDGLQIIQERDANNNPLVTYTRGLDLSGTRTGAGGIGGLLARTDVGGSAYYHADGNGNITMLINAAGTMQAKYLYDSFGNPLGMWGTLAGANKLRFSSMEADDKLGIDLSVYRFFVPNLQRWLNQDPIEEAGGINLYGFVGNDPVNNIDPLGLLTAVIIGGPISSNPFGHAAIATTGNGVFSFGTQTGFGSNLTDYLNKQATYRNSTVYVLNTTPEQEKAINDYLNSKKGKPINRYPDNCAHRVSEALEAGGVAPYDLTKMPQSDSFDLGSNNSGNWPLSIGDALKDAGTFQIFVPQGDSLPPNFLTGFNPKP